MNYCKAIVDLQGFKDDANNFILKEIAIMCCDQMQLFLFLPPFPFYDLTKTERRQVCWIERNRKINWNDGLIPYHRHKELLTLILKDKIIYVKGSEKVTWLQKILKTGYVYNIEDNNCPSLLSLYEKYCLSKDVFTCFYHPTICALKNVLCIRQWCFDNKLFLN